MIFPRRDLRHGRVLVVGRGKGRGLNALSSEEFIRYFNNNYPRFPVPDGTDYVDWVIENNIATVGTPNDAIERIEQIYAKQGEFGAVLLQVTQWADWSARRRSFELYAEYVIPYFSHANENRSKSYSWVTANQEELVTKRVNAAQRMFAKHAAETEASDENVPATDGPVNSPRLA